MSPQPCTRCLYFGLESPLQVGHSCVDPDPCKRCGGPRSVRVVSRDARGWLSVTVPCVQCKAIQRGD